MPGLPAARRAAGSSAIIPPPGTDARNLPILGKGQVTFSRRQIAALARQPGHEAGDARQYGSAFATMSWKSAANTGGHNGRSSRRAGAKGDPGAARYESLPSDHSL